MAKEFYKEAFQYVMEELKKEYISKKNEDEFKIWFNMTYVEDSIDSITVSVASPFMKMMMSSKGYFEIVEKKLEETTGQKIKINCVIVNEKPESAKEEFPAKSEKKPSKPNFTKDLKTDSILDELTLENPPSESKKEEKTSAVTSTKKTSSLTGKLYI